MIEDKSCRQKSIDQSAEDSQFLLKRHKKGDLYLDNYHAHYFDVQTQLKFCFASYTDIAILTEEQLFGQRIWPHERFISIMLEWC